MLDNMSKAAVWVKAVSDSIAEQVVSGSGRMLIPRSAYPEDATDEIVSILCRVPEVLNIEIQEGTKTIVLTLEKGLVL